DRRLRGADIGRDLHPRRLGRRARPRSDIEMVFQSYALFPHMSVFDNVAYPLRTRRLPSTEVAERVARVLDAVHMHVDAARLAVLGCGDTAGDQVASDLDESTVEVDVGPGAVRRGARPPGAASGQLPAGVYPPGAHQRRLRS